MDRRRDLVGKHIDEARGPSKKVTEHELEQRNGVEFVLLATQRDAELVERALEHGGVLTKNLTVELVERLEDELYERANTSFGRRLALEGARLRMKVYVAPQSASKLACTDARAIVQRRERVERERPAGLNARKAHVAELGRNVVRRRRVGEDRELLVDLIHHVAQLVVRIDRRQLQLQDQSIDLVDEQYNTQSFLDGMLDDALGLHHDLAHHYESQLYVRERERERESKGRCHILPQQHRR